MKCHRQKYCYLLLQIIFFVTDCFARNVTFNINFKKPIAVTSSAFLSLTLDPATLVNATDALTKNIERSTNIARGLSPAYFRLGGPLSNSYIFEKAYLRNSDIDSNESIETQWSLIYRWAKRSGLNVITCIKPGYIDNGSKMHSPASMNIADFLSFSNRMGYNTSWQLGYECETRCELSGENLGQYNVNLREALKTFSRYSNSLITGPDIVAYKTMRQQKYLQDYLNSAGTALSAITWHPNFAGVSLNNDSVSVHYDNMATEKDELYKIIGRVAGKKPLWIAESKPEECKHQYVGALIWTRRLGNAAKLGIQVVMRQLSDFNKITPDYWISLLHKTLVGREVLDMKIQSHNESHMHFYSQCTKPSARYEKGAITIFGVNLTPKKVIANSKSLKIKTLHKYILSPDSEIDNNMFSEKILLNNKKLNLINDRKLPDLEPELITDPNGLELPSGSIGFWVIPDAKIEACMHHEEQTTENIVTRKIKRRENMIRQINQEEKFKKNREDINQPNFKNSKIYVARQDENKQEHTRNAQIENQQIFWRNRLFTKLTKLLQKSLRRNGKSNFVNFNRSSRFTSGESQEDLFEDAEKRQNLNNRQFEKTEETDYESETNEDIRDILRRYKHVLLMKKKIQIETKYAADHKLDMKNIDYVVALLSKIDTLLQLNETGITSGNPLSGIIDESYSVKKWAIGANGRLKEKSSESKGSAITKTEIIEKIEKYFGILHELLKYNGSKENSNISVYQNSTERKRFKRELNKKMEDPKIIGIFGKHSNLDDLKNRMSKQKMKQRKNDDKKELSSIRSNLKSLNDKNLYSLFRQGPIKKFLKSDVFPGLRTNSQRSIRKSERTKRDVSKKLIEMGLKKDNIFRRHSRIDDHIKDHIIERKMKRKEALIPFDLKTTGSNENNFYGFYRRKPIKGFPEGDIFVTAGESGEQSSEDYDYIEDDESELKKKNARQRQKSGVDIADDTWIEVDCNHQDYVPNEFFEKVKLSNTNVKQDPKDYGELSEAEFFHGEYENGDDHGTIDAPIPREQPSNEEEERQVRKENMQKLANYYEDPEMQDYNQDTKYETLELGVKHSSSVHDQLIQTPITGYDYANHKTLDMKNKKPFHQPAAVSIAEYNYDNYQTPTASHSETKLNEEKVSKVNRSNDEDDVTKEDLYFPKSPAVHIENPIRDEAHSNSRAKRSDRDELRRLLAEEMIKEDEGNAKDCHCRVIRAADLPKRLCYCHAKRSSQVSAITSENSSSESERAIKQLHTNAARSKRDIDYPTTTEEYDKIMTGEILPELKINDTQSNYNETGTIMEIVDAQLNGSDHTSSNETRTIEELSTSPMAHSRTNDISKQSDNNERFNREILSVDSSSPVSIDNNDILEEPTGETFFRVQSQSDMPEDKTTAYDLAKTISELPSSNEEDLITSFAQETTSINPEQIQDFDKNKETDKYSPLCTVAESKKNQKRRNNNYKNNLRSIESLKGTTKENAEEQTAIETILSKRAIGKATTNSRSSEAKSKVRSQQNTKNNQDIYDNIINLPHLEKDDDLKRAKSIIRNLPKTPLKELARYEEYLKKRTTQIEKLNEKLYARRDKLLLQYRDELTKIADEQKRNLKRRETWGKFREGDDLRRLIDQDKLVRVLISDDVTQDDEDEKEYAEVYVPIDIIPKQYNSHYSDILMQQFDPRELTSDLIGLKYSYAEPMKQEENNGDEIEADCMAKEKWMTPWFYEQRLQDKSGNVYLLPEIKYLKKSKAPSQTSHSTTDIKETRYPKESHYHTFIQHPKKDRREPQELSKPSNRKIFAVDPSTYRGGEPILQVHEDYVESARQSPKTKFQTNIPKLTLDDLYKLSSELARNQHSEKTQHQAFKPSDNYYYQEYVKKVPIEERYKQERANVLYVLDAHRQYDLPKELAGLPRIWLSPINRRDINRANKALNNKIASELRDIQKNIELQHNNPIPATVKLEEIESAKIMNETNLGTGRHIKNEGPKELTNTCIEEGDASTVEIDKLETKEIIGLTARKKDTENIGIAEDAEEIMGIKNVDDAEKKNFNIRISKSVAESIKRESLNNKEENITHERISKSAEKINDINLNDEMIHIKTFNNNEEIIDNIKESEISESEETNNMLNSKAFNIVKENVHDIAGSRTEQNENSLKGKILKNIENSIKEDKVIESEKTDRTLNIITFKIVEGTAGIDKVNGSMETIDKLNITKIRDSRIRNVSEEEGLQEDEDTMDFRTARDVEEIMEDNNKPKTNELGRVDTRIRRNIEKQMDNKYLERLPYFLTNRTSTKEPNHDKYIYLKKNSMETLSEDPITLAQLIRREGYHQAVPVINAASFRKPKNYLILRNRNFEVNQHDGKKHRSSKYVILVPIKMKDINPMLRTKNYKPSLEYFDSSSRSNKQYLASIPMNEYSDYESSEENGYENLSDLLRETTENISDEEAACSLNHSNESNGQEILIGIPENSELVHESTEEDEKYKANMRGLYKHMNLKDRIRPDEHGMFMLLPWKNEKTRRQRRQIKSEIDEGSDHIKHRVQSESYQSIFAKSMQDTEYNLNNNNIGKVNNLKSEIDNRNHEATYLLKDFIEAQKRLKKQSKQPKITTDSIMFDTINLNPSILPSNNIKNIKSSHNIDINNNNSGIDRKANLNVQNNNVNNNILKIKNEHINKYSFNPNINKKYYNNNFEIKNKNDNQDINNRSNSGNNLKMKNKNDDNHFNIINKNIHNISFTKSEGNNTNSKNNILRSNKKLPFFIDKTIPKLQDAITDGIKMTQNLTESVEQFVDNFEEQFNKTLAEETFSKNQTSGNTDNIFHAAIMNINRFFMLLSGISRILNV